MLPRILSTGVNMVISSFAQRLMSFSTTPVSTTLWILDLVVSHPYDMAQRESIKVSLSKTPALAIRQSWVIPFLMSSYLGRGTPLQRLDRVQATCLMRFLSLLELEIFIRCSMAPAWMILSRCETQSPDKLPMAQTAWSTRPGLFWWSSWMKMGMPPLSMTDSHCAVLPEHTLVKTQMASSCSCGYSVCLHISMKMGMS